MFLIHSAQADIELAIGAGTDVAKEAADIALLSGSPAWSPRSGSHATMRNIRQNLSFALVYNGVGIAIAAGVLDPFLGTRLRPFIATPALATSSPSSVRPTR